MIPERKVMSKEEIQFVEHVLYMKEHQENNRHIVSGETYYISTVFTGVLCLVTLALGFTYLFFVLLLTTITLIAAPALDRKRRSLKITDNSILEKVIYSGKIELKYIDDSKDDKYIFVIEGVSISVDSASYRKYSIDEFVMVEKSVFHDILLSVR